MSDPLGFGIDLSHHQDPAILPWSSWEGKVDFVIVRASYGANIRDGKAQEHVLRARDIGAKVGLYQFFRIGESVDAHVSTLHAIADLCRIDDGDIVPALDIEADPIPKPARPVKPDWSGPTEALASAIATDWGNCIIYITQREWGMLGAPSWVLHRPLWCAHYTDAKGPSTPAGMPATIWQHRVGAFDPSGPGGFFKNQIPQLDQNRLLAPLPLIGQPITPEEKSRIEGLVAKTLAESVHELIDTKEERRTV